MADPYRLVGKRVREILKLRRWSMEKLAEAVGLSPNYIGLIERGEAHAMLDKLESIARVLEVELGELFQQDGSEKKTIDQVLQDLKRELRHYGPETAGLIVSISKQILRSIPTKK